jgi:hypothetical protein
LAWFVRDTFEISYLCTNLPENWLVSHQEQEGNKYTGHTQKNGAVSKVNKKFMSHITWAQHTPSVAATVQVSHALPAVRFSCLLRGRGASFKDFIYFYIYIHF